MTLLTRRKFVAAAGTTLFFSTACTKVALAQADTDRRFVFIIQRGAADGLATLAPVADPAFVSQRGALAAEFGDAPKLDGFFALHPKLEGIGKLYADKQALFIHAVASPYRDRSHFDGQNVLETGAATAYSVNDGWLNRLLSLLPKQEARGIALSPAVPMALRGPMDVASYAPSALPNASDDLVSRVTRLYDGDAQLHAAWEQAVNTRILAGSIAQDKGKNPAATGALAGRLLSGPTGSRIAMIETIGWDTHAQQRGRLATQMRGLDSMVGALKQELGAQWDRTLVLVATEFGRTVRVNGTGGTDHGTGSLAMLLGGAAAGGRVISDWPGLSGPALLEGRDLKPTTSLDALIASALSEHFGLDQPRVMQALFPDSGRAPVLHGLVRSA